MDIERMRELYDEGRFDSVQFLLNHRGEILDHTGMLVPQRPVEASEWWEDNKATFARKINKSGNSDSSDESSESDNE